MTVAALVQDHALIPLHAGTVDFLEQRAIDLQEQFGSVAVPDAQAIGAAAVFAVGLLCESGRYPEPHHLGRVLNQMGYTLQHAAVTVLSRIVDHKPETEEQIGVRRWLTERDRELRNYASVFHR